MTADIQPHIDYGTYYPSPLYMEARRHTRGGPITEATINNYLYPILSLGKATGAFGTLEAIKNISSTCLIQGGRFYGGIFHSGTFRAGEFYGGEFHGGRFDGGWFYSGVYTDLLAVYYANDYYGGIDPRRSTKTHNNREYYA